MKRKEFIKRTAIVATLGLPILSVLSSCSTEEEPTPPPPPPDPKDCLANGTASSIGSNHGHAITVSKDDVTVGTEKTYAIGNGADHDHNVTITAANFSTLQSNTSIQVESTLGSGHSHGITVSCA
jgi:hypothetical protein